MKTGINISSIQRGIKVGIEDMNPDDSKYYSIEFVDEDYKLFVLFYNDKDELVERRELPKNATIEQFVRERLLGDN